MSDEWRVEVRLDAEHHGVSLTERLRSRELDDEARARLGDRVIVTRNGSELFLYAGGGGEAREAEHVVSDLLAEHDLSAEVAVTRWHPVEETWRDASVPLPRTEQERRVEHDRLEAAELREVAEEGRFDWEVRVKLPTHRYMSELADRLEAEGLSVTRRWRYLLVGTLTEDGARDMAARIEADAPEGTEAEIGANLDEPSHPLFVFLESR